MTSLASKLALALFVSGAILTAASARAQQDNPFEAAGDQPFAEEPAADEDPAQEAPPEDAAIDEPAATEPAAPTPAPAATPPADAPSLADFARRDPAVAAVLDLPRQTPIQQLRALGMLIDLGHPDVAGLLLPELLQAPVDDSQRAALVRELGPARFMQFIRLDNPAAPGPLAGLRAYAQACLDAAAAEARDPKRIAALVAKLNAPTEDERYAARVDLRATGDAGIMAAFAALAAATTADARANIMLALADMRPAVDEPLLAVLADSDGTLRRDAAELAGHLKIEAATPLLAAIAVSGDQHAAAAALASLAKLGLPKPSAAEAQELVHRRLANAKTGPAPTTGDDTTGPWWSWNPETKQLAVTAYSGPQLRALMAARLTHALTHAGGRVDAADLRLAVLYGLEESALLARKPSEQLVNAIAAMTPGDLSEALGTATAEGFVAAAVELAGELARRGDATILATSSGLPSPLAAALTSRDRAVRFAALSAIMQLAPPRSFPGSSHVADSLWYFVAGAGKPTAIVASADIVEASTWAGELRAAGYEATPVRTGREALIAAIDPATSSRLGLVLLDSDVGQPLMGEVAYQLHANARTAGVPILIASSVPRLAAAQRIAASDPLVMATPRPHGPGALAAIAEQTIALTARPMAPPEARLAQASQALQWLATLLANGSPYDELQRDGALVGRTLMISELAAPSLAVLGGLGTAPSQVALVEFASSHTAAIEARRTAAKAFVASVQRHGLQLSREEVLRQYDRYNASETADADTQQVLGQILDVIEKKPQTAATP